jgi:hypothetical protein
VLIIKVILILICLAAIVATGGLVLIIPIYILPTIVAFKRQKVNAGQIMLINLLLGWTVVFWCTSLWQALSTNQLDMEQRGIVIKHR